MRDFENIVTQFENEFGFEFLKQTREREYVEARATLIYYLSKFKKYGLVPITQLIEQKTGWKINHATIHHSIKNYEIYSKYNPKLEEALRAVVGFFDNKNDKIQYIKNHIDKLPEKSVNELHENIMDAYEKIATEKNLTENSL